MFDSKIVLLLLSSLLFSCNNTHITGLYVEKSKVAQLKANNSLTKNEVLQLIGSPTLTPLHSADTWYYIGRTTKRKFLFAPRVENQEVLRIRFNNNKVCDVILRQEQDKSNAKISINTNDTANAGINMNAAETYLYNLRKIRPNKLRK